MSKPTVDDDSVLDGIVNRIFKERDAGMMPDQAVYLLEFPDLAEQLREIFSGIAILAGNDGENVNFPKPESIVDGKYKLIEEIGEGGMGHVWLAQRTVDLNRPVAIKFIKAGMDSARMLARFEFERQVLAMMNHPNIATVFDAGMTENGRPYFAMEYVEGCPITGYCDAVQLDIRERLRLFTIVCDAVQHSHHTGIIHRDLKPSNILISLAGDVPIPKVIDFGLAKAMDQSLTPNSIQTEYKEFAGIGTLRYMSPEQAGVNGFGIDVRSDIYSMGVVLYELLVGTTPLEPDELKDAGESEAIRYLQDFDPPQPSIRFSHSVDRLDIAQNRLISPNDLRATLASELDWVVMRALDKDKSRRYQSMGEFKADIERFLSGEPVTARPPSTYYRANKFVRRHRGPVFGALAIIVGVAAFVLWMSFDLYRRRALENRINVNQVEYLRAAEAKAFSRRLAELKSAEYATFVGKLIYYQRLKPATNDLEKRRDSLARMALLSQLPNTDFERELVQSIEADEILAVSSTLKRLPSSELATLQKLLIDRLRTSSESSTQESLGRFGVLCQIDSAHLGDQEFLDEVASRLCDLSSIELASWQAVFQPLGDKLVARFEQIIEDEDAGQQRRTNAASLWVGFRAEQVQAVVEMGLKAPAVAYAPFVFAWKFNHGESLEFLRVHLASKPMDDSTADVFVKAALGLANLGDTEPLWQCFSGSFGESARALAITQCQPRLVPFEVLAARMHNTRSAMELASLIAAFGTYPVDKLRIGINETLVESLKREYQSNPSSSVHGACESTLVRWKIPLPSIEIAATMPAEDLRWYRSPSGMDLITLQIPQLPPTPGGLEQPAHRIAVSTREVTVAEFRRFLEEDVYKRGSDSFLYKVEVSPNGDCPQNSVSWHMGAQFCNWLSLNEGIAEDQLCFEVDPSEQLLCRLKKNTPLLSGYRFPSLAEARAFCGGINQPFDQARPNGELMTSNFPWGNDPRLLNEFAFTAENAMGRTWPAGHRLPNNLGLHDTIGSLLEWTVTVDPTASGATCTGGNYINALPELFHIQTESQAGLNFRNFYLGFRVVRTLEDK